MGNTVAMVSLPVSEEQPSLGRTDMEIPVVAQSDKSLPLTVKQGVTAESMLPEQGVPIKGQQERERVDKLRFHPGRTLHKDRIRFSRSFRCLLD